MFILTDIRGVINATPFHSQRLQQTQNPKTVVIVESIKQRDFGVVILD